MNWKKHHRHHPSARLKRFYIFIYIWYIRGFYYATRNPLVHFDQEADYWNKADDKISNYLIDVIVWIKPFTGYASITCETISWLITKSVLVIISSHYHLEKKERLNNQNSACFRWLHRDQFYWVEYHDYCTQYLPRLFENKHLHF